MEKKRLLKENCTLKGILKAQKKTYEYMGKLIGTTTGNFSNKINGYSHFTAYEVYKISMDCGIKGEQVEKVFFEPYTD